jgi:2-ketoarginine methyltransferase
MPPRMTVERTESRTSTVPGAHQPHEHLPRLLDYVAKWATAEVLRGLLSFPELHSALAGGVTEDELCDIGTASNRQFRSLLQALEVEGIAAEASGVWSLTEFGSAATGTLIGWFDIFLSGYGEYFRNARALWAGEPDPRWRDMRSVGTSSVNISRHGALPLVARLIDRYQADASLVVDVGCADATYLVELCSSCPGLTGIGVEPAEQLRTDAQDLIARSGLGHRITLVDSIASLTSQEIHPDFFVFGFSLHELVEQTGRAAVIELLREIAREHPAARLLVAEADYSARSDVEAMTHDPHLRGYYNYYYMLHDFTDQILLTRPEWRDLFDEAGLTIIEERAIDPEYDPTGMEIVFVLARGLESGVAPNVWRGKP